jgi:hypothetical protein
MKFLQFLLRVGGSFLIALIVSFSSAVIFFNYSGYENISDRIFLVTVPTLAIGYLLYESFPKFWPWLLQRQLSTLIGFGVFALLGSAAVVLPALVSRTYYLGMISLALALFILMLPAAPALERMRSTHSMTYYFLGFALNLVISYGVIGFMGGVFSYRFDVIVFSILITIIGSLIGYYLVRRASHSLRNGFLSNPLSLFLVISLPVFLAAILYLSLQFPSMFSLAYIQIPVARFGMFISSVVVAGAWGLPLLEQFEARGYYAAFKQTKTFAFIKENLPGIYAASLFFGINLIIARALNHPTFSINSIVFEADAGPWMSILGFPEGHDVNRAVHPLVLITLRPFVGLIQLFTADKWFLGPIIAVAAMNGLCIFMAWLFAKRATQKDSYAFVFAIILGVTAAHMLFGSLTETYVFGMTSLILFFVLVQADEKRFSVLVPAGILVFGITVTNIAQSMIALFFKKFGFWKLVYYGVIVLTISIALTAFVSVLYPGNQTFFWVPADLAFEGRFSKPIYVGPMDRVIEKFGVVGRAIFFHGVVAPTPIEDFTRKTTDPLIDFKTHDYHEHVYAWYNGAAYVPVALWLTLFAGAIFLFFKNIRSSPHVPLMLGLLGSIAFTYFLHMNYGTELFLYSPYWTYLLIFFIALAYVDLAGRRWFESVLTIFAVTLMINNAWFIFIILRGLAPYLAAS